MLVLSWNYSQTNIGVRESCVVAYFQPETVHRLAVRWIFRLGPLDNLSNYMKENGVELLSRCRIMQAYSLPLQ